MLKKAPEIALNGPKNFNAKAVANPEFCIPISKAIVFAILLE